MRATDGDRGTVMESSHPGEGLVFAIERDALPLGELRRWIARSLPQLGADHLWAAELVATELVTNAYEHGAGPITVTVSATAVPCSALLQVHDEGDGRPEAWKPSPATPRGRGLILVGDLSSAWGVWDTGSGKTVWARIACGAGTIEACPVRREPILTDPEPC